MLRTRPGLFGCWVFAVFAGFASGQTVPAPDVQSSGAALGAGRAERLEQALARADWPGPERLAGALEAASDPDPDLRALAVGTLSKAEWGNERLEERVSALAVIARNDPSARLRGMALEALGAFESPNSATALEALCADSYGSEALAAAQALVGLRSSTEAIDRLVRRGLAEPGAVDSRALAELLEAYGESLAERPDAGLDPASRAPLIAGRRHPDGAIRAAAARGITRALERFLWLGREARIGGFLEGCAADGLELRDLGYRAAALLISRGSDASLALGFAERLADRVDPEFERVDPLASATQRFHGHYLCAAIHLAERKPALAYPRLLRAEQALIAILQTRPETRRRHNAPSEPDATAAVDAAERLSMCRVLFACVRLSEGAATDDPDVVAALRSAHTESLRAGWIAAEADLDTGGGTLETVLDRDLGPRRLLAGNDRLPGWSRAEWLELLERLGDAFAGVAGPELPGFEGSELPRAEDSDALADPLRRQLLERTLVARVNAVSARIADPEEAGNRRLWLQVEQSLLAKLAQQDDRVFWEERTPSLAALDLAREWRQAGESQRAVDLALALRKALAGPEDDREIPLGAIFRDWLEARVSLVLGSALSDLDRPEEAEAELLAAHGRLEALENTLESRLADLEQGRLGVRVLEEVDPLQRRVLEGQRDQTQRLRADVLVSLAVNANVKQGQPERALDYFERAHELEQSEFMTVLAACYRARAGRFVEARFLLDRLSSSPELAYNLACTYALMGDEPRALDALEQDLLDLERTPAALDRQKRWAAEDPDLSNLRENPRFLELVRVESGEAEQAPGDGSTNEAPANLEGPSGSEEGN